MQRHPPPKPRAAHCSCQAVEGHAAGLHGPALKLMHRSPVRSCQRSLLDQGFLLIRACWCCPMLLQLAPAWLLSVTGGGSVALGMPAWNGRMTHHLPPHHPRYDPLPVHAKALTGPSQRYALGPPCHLIGQLWGRAGWGLSALDPMGGWLLGEEVGVVVGVQSQQLRVRQLQNQGRWCLESAQSSWGTLQLSLAVHVYLPGPACVRTHRMDSLICQLAEAWTAHHRCMDELSSGMLKVWTTLSNCAVCCQRNYT